MQAFHQRFLRRLFSRMRQGFLQGCSLVFPGIPLGIFPGITTLFPFGIPPETPSIIFQGFFLEFLWGFHLNYYRDLFLGFCPQDIQKDLYLYTFWDYSKKKNVGSFKDFSRFSPMDSLRYSFRNSFIKSS